jgi:hypothetical protein
MPTQTKFLITSGVALVDLSGVFEPLNGGTSYTSAATKYKVGGTDLTGIFHASTSVDDRVDYDTGYKITVGGTPVDLKTIFRKYGFVGITITSQPTNQFIDNNTAATFSITATAAGTPTYQWYKNGSIISGATSTSYTTGALTTANDNDTYFCRVSYSGSYVDSNSVGVKIKSYIISHPSNLTVHDGDPGYFEVQGGGSQTLNFKWLIVNSPTFDPEGAGNVNSNTDRYNLSEAASDYNQNGALFRCLVKNSHYGQNNDVSSNFATLTIISPLATISSYLGQTQFNQGDFVQLSSTITNGAKNVSYQWYKNGNIISGATSSTYNFQINGSGDTGSYTLVVSNRGGSYTTNAISVSIIAPEVTVGITGYTPPFVFNNGTVVTLTATLSQGQNVTYQWYGPNGIISGATSASYIFALSAANDGNYYVVATNAGGSDTSNTVSIYLNPYIITNPSSITVNAGGNASFTVSAEGSGTLNYQWYRSTSGGASYSAIGASNSTFVDIGVTSAYDGYKYYCVVSSSVSGSSPVQSTVATLTVNYAPSNPSITGQEIYNNGNAVAFTASVTLGKPTSTTYTWQRSIDGGFNWSQVAQTTTTASSDELSVGTAGMGISGYKYRCVISNSVGSVTTAVKTVYINPYITANPSSTTVNSGSNATFTVSAQGSGTLTYTWYRNGATFGAANSPSFTEVGTAPSQNGNTYYCVVSSSISGTSPATSSTATLTVEYAPIIGSVRFNGTTVTSNLQAFTIANGLTFTLQAVSVDDGQPNATSRGWYRYDGTTSPDPEGYNELLGTSDSVTTDQGDNETQYYRYRIANTEGTTQSFEIEVNTI